MKKITLFAGVALFVIACSPKTTEAVVETVTEEAVEAMPTAEIGQGKAIYDSKCQSCHELKTVEAYNATQWSNILPNMAGQAGLTEEQTALVDQYITWKIAK